MKKIIENNIEREMTSDEETQYLKDITESQKVATEQAEAITQAEADKEAKDVLKASAKAKLIAGEALTEDEANTIVL